MTAPLRYLLHGATLALAWFLIFNLAATLVVAVLAPRLTARATPASPGFWLALRLAPAALSSLFVIAVFLPSYWRYEPREFVEGFDLTLTTLGVLAFAIVVAGAVRGVSASRRAARRTEQWLRAARPLTVPGSAIPAFAIDTLPPVMALVGVFRPRLLITQPVLDALTDEELRAASAHEAGHWRAWDNLKRLAMRAAPDLLSATAAARALERRWVMAAERVADRAAGESGSERCALASALVKVARLTPPTASIAEPISGLLDGGDITARVQRLLDDAPPAETRRRAGWFAATLAVIIPAAALALGYAPLLRVVHAITELLVSTLP
jgi:Zn-dependent protease with chaperone function